MKTSSKLFLSWSTHIFSFNFKLLPRRGSIHLNADILSRENQLQDNPTAQDTAETHIHSIFPAIKTCKLSACGICAISLSSASALQRNFHSKKNEIWPSKSSIITLFTRLQTKFRYRIPSWKRTVADFKTAFVPTHSNISKEIRLSATSAILWLSPFVKKQL